jgi:hypothetical protein
MSNPCNARILTKSFVVGGVTLYDTGECQQPATKHVWVDDADSRMYICGKCIRRWLTKNHTPSQWYGWFDCQTPPLTPAAESTFYIDVLRKTYGNKTIKELRKDLLNERIETQKITELQKSLESLTLR